MPKEVSEANQTPEQDNKIEETENRVLNEEANLKQNQSQVEDKDPPEPSKTTQNKAIQVAEKNQEIIEIKPTSSTTNTPQNRKPKNQLENQVQELHQAYLRSAHKAITNLSVSIYNTYDLSKNPFLGEHCSLLALKDHNSFMISTAYKGILLLRNGTKLYSAPFKGFVKDLLYIEDYDAYFLSVGSHIYRKDINQKVPYKFMELSCGFRMAASFRYSKLNRRLIVNKNFRTISVVNLDNQEVEIDIEDDFLNTQPLNDFRLLGELEDRVISARNDDYIILYKIDYARKKGSITAKIKVPLIKARKEQMIALAVCSKREYVFIEVGQTTTPSICCRMILERVIGDKLTLVGKLDQFSEKLGVKIAFECYGYIGNHILWVGLTKGKNGKIQIFDFDTETNDLAELIKCRRSFGELSPEKLNRIGQDFYYIGYNAKPKKLVFKI